MLMDPDTAWAIAIWTAACVLSLVCLAQKVREWDREAEDRRRRRDAAAFRAQLAGMTETETKRWNDWAAQNHYGPAVLWGSTSETPIFDATVADTARQEAADLDDEWLRIQQEIGGGAA